MFYYLSKYLPIHFIYTVAIGKKQNQSQIQFFFAGELINDQSGTFIGMATYNNMNANSNISNTTSSFYVMQVFLILFNIFTIMNIKNIIYLVLIQQVFLLMDFTNQFVFVFDSQNHF